LGREQDRPAARLAFLASFPLLLLCPVLLTIDLGRPERFWHMIVDPAQGIVNFKYWSPMSVGVWGLTIFGVFSFVMFAWALAAGRGMSIAGIFDGLLGRVVMVLGSIAGLYICAYTGVLLSVSNQPVWSDGWPLGGLFLASAMSGAAALLMIATRLRPEAVSSAPAIADADRYFVVIEVLLVIAFLVTVGLAGTLSPLFGGIFLVLWLLVAVGVALPLVGHHITGARSLSPLVTSVVVLLGVLALRAVVIFGAQS
jgi:formate-dependent nitrite reductase membrane component NrfD